MIEYNLDKIQSHVTIWIEKKEDKAEDSYHCYDQVLTYYNEETFTIFQLYFRVILFMDKIKSKYVDKLIYIKVWAYKQVKMKLSRSFDSLGFWFLKRKASRNTVVTNNYSHQGQ